MKPRLGREVYCIYEDTINVEEVYAIGKDSFIVASFSDSTYEDSWEYFFDQYQEVWFTSLARAKKKLLQNARGEGCTNPRILKVSKDYYVLECD